MPRQPTYTKQMWRGAKIGAVSLGAVSFLSGITVCVAYHLPVPPLFITELGILLGGCFGGLGGYAACFPSGRAALRGMLFGALLGLPVAGLLQGSVRLLVWLACVVMATLIGYQAGCSPVGGRESGWKLHR